MADPKAGVDDLCAGAGHARDIKLASLMHRFGYPYAVQFQGGRILTSKAVINLEDSQSELNLSKHRDIEFHRNRVRFTSRVTDCGWIHGNPA